MAEGHERYRRMFEDARDANDKYRSEAFIDRDYFDGYQLTPDQRAVLNERKQPALYFNEVRVSIRGLVGVWEQGETDPRAWPKGPEDEQAADVATKALRFVKDYNDWAALRTACALNYFVEGTCASFVGIDSDNRPRIEPVAFEEFFHDPRSRKLDFSDARYKGVAKWLFVEDVAQLYPDKRELIEGGFEESLSVGGDTFADRPDGSRAEWFDGKLRRVFVVEMYHREGGEWQRCVFWGRGVLEVGVSPWVDDKGHPVCPIIARSCYIDRENNRYGEVRDLRSPQDSVNAREMKLLHLVNSRQVQASDPEYAMMTDAETVRIQASRPDGVIPPGWQPVPTSDMASGQVLLLESARSFIQRIGQNPGILASQSASASGRAQQVRQQAGMTDSAMTLNGLRRFELDVFKAAWQRCRQFWRQPDYIRVTGDEKAAEFVPVNEPVFGAPQPMLSPDGQVVIGQPVLGYNNAFAEMAIDITIDAVPDTANLASEQFEVLAGLMERGVQIPPVALIRASSLPNKQDILDEMEGVDPAQQQAMAMQQELQMRGVVAEVRKTEAEADLTEAKARNEIARPAMEGLRTGLAA